MITYSIKEAVEATQHSLLQSLEKVFKECKEIGTTKGLTYEQIQYIIDRFKEKKPLILEVESSNNET